MEPQHNVTCPSVVYTTVINKTQKNRWKHSVRSGKTSDSKVVYITICFLGTDVPQWFCLGQCIALGHSEICLFPLYKVAFTGSKDPEILFSTLKSKSPVYSRVTGIQSLVKGRAVVGLPTMDYGTFQFRYTTRYVLAGSTRNRFNSTLKSK